MMQIKFFATSARFSPLLFVFAACMSAAHAEAPLENQIQQAAQTWLDQYVKQHQLQDARVEAEVLPAARPAPACDAPFEIKPFGEGRLGHLSFAVRCPNNARATPTYYQVRTSVFAKVVVAAVDIPARQPIEIDDLTLAEKNLATTPDTLTDPNAAAGRVSRRSLAAGSVVEAHFLQGQTDVKHGQVVQIIARHQQIEVSAPGLALQNGAKGDTIRVRNTSTNKEIAARVTGPGVVEPLMAP
jgi:flagella basal body P-ring formation protein FlgA